MSKILNIINSDKHFYDFIEDGYLKCMEGSFHSAEIKEPFEMNLTDINNIVENKKYIYLIECGTRESVHYIFTGKGIPQEIIDLVNKDVCKVVIAYEQEGDIDIDAFNRWYENEGRFRESEIKFSNFYVLHAELNCQDKNKTPVNFFSSTHYFDAISYGLLSVKRDNNFQELKGFDYNFKVNTIDDIDLEKKSKYFLSLMRTGKRPHRIALASYYEYNKLWESNNISWLKVGMHQNPGFPSVLDEKYRSSYKEVMNKDKVELDTQNIENKWKNYAEVTATTYFTDKWDLYQETFLRVVSETYYDIENIFMTEKIMKPLYNLHPFIVTTSPFFLKKLKELGFKTFSPFIDESYDNETNHKKRMELIFDELDRFRNKSLDELKSWWKDILPILEHNQKTFFNMSIEKTKKIKLLEEFCE